MFDLSFIYSLTTHLIEIMGAVLLVALVFRYLSYRATKRDKVYYNTFSATVEKTLEKSDPPKSVENLDQWLKGFLDEVSTKLPQRTLRTVHQATPNGSEESISSFRHQDRQSLTDYAGGHLSVIHAMKQYSDTLKSPYPPNFNELTNQILSQDGRWVKVAGVPTETLANMMKILPGLFVVGGIFGTFIGITNALPLIAQIDLSQLDKAAPILQGFVTNVSYSMNTSIAGIVYSVTLTVINTWMPISVGRNSIRKNIRRSVEFMWHHMHGNKVSSGEKQMISTLEKIHHALEDGRHKKSA
jgi:hypothetical protein